MLAGSPAMAADIVRPVPNAADSAIIEPLNDDAIVTACTYSIERAIIELIGLAIIAMLLTWAFRNTRRPVSTLDGPNRSTVDDDIDLPAPSP